MCCSYSVILGNTLSNPNKVHGLLLHGTPNKLHHNFRRRFKKCKMRRENLGIEFTRNCRILRYVIFVFQNDKNATIENVQMVNFRANSESKRIRGRF